MKDVISLHELSELFHQALALPISARAAFLDRHCENRPTLRAELQRVLDADGQHDALLDRPLVDCLSNQRHLQIGRWNVSEPIGEGGLGVVYRASCEADGVKLHAALKTLRAGFDEGEFRARFVQERSILSGIDHPYIARLIDAGADANGDSFLAIEFVDGQLLHQYLQCGASLVDALHLFIRICEAVEYLHSNRIVHGDIKPSNVMVRYDGTPKLLDFGCACVIGWTAEDASVNLSRMMVTPSYASPERRSGSGPSVQSDVYSLGCVLRDMLEQKTPDADLCAIRDRCLCVAPEGRYVSAADIAADVHRYFGHFPVRARRVSGWYVTSKFLRRNGTASCLASVAIAALLTGWLLSWQHARRADLYASQHRSVVNHLLSNEDGKQSAETVQRSAFAAGMHDVIGQLERMKSPPLAELTNAYRRLGYAEAGRGRSLQGVQSIRRSVEYARQYQAATHSPDADAQLAESLFFAALLQLQRGYRKQAGEFAGQAIRLTNALPLPQESALLQQPQFLNTRAAAARTRVRAGDIQGAREILLDGLEQSRSFSKSVQQRLLLDLSLFERSAGNASQAEFYCDETKSLELDSPRQRKVCAVEEADDSRPADSVDAERGSALVHEMNQIERRLVADPENFSDRRRLAMIKLQLARTAGQSGNAPRARRLIEEARALTQTLVELDPKNRRLQNLTANIDRAAARIAELP